MILITGATGLIGSHAALYLLEKGIAVRAIYRTKSSLSRTRLLFKGYGKEDLFDKIEWINANINDIPALEPAFIDVDEVWHCAALISFSRKDEDRLRKVNIEGTANMVNLSIDFGVEKFCFISSIAALGDTKNASEIIDEEMEWNPEKHHSDYAISKYGAEMEVWRGQQEGLKVVIVNPGVVLGPGFWDRGSGEIFTAVANDLPFYTTGCTGFVAVTDLVEIMYLLMNNNLFGERFAIVSENIIYRDLAFEIADLMKVKRPGIHATSWMTEASWIFDYLLAGLFRKKRKIYRETARAVHDEELYSNKKVCNALSYKFTDIGTYLPKVIELQGKVNPIA